MGNWRAVNIVGTLDEADVPKMKELHAIDFGDDGWNCLTAGPVPSLGGLPPFASERFDEVGNLHERDFTVEDVVEAIESFREACPSLRCVIHCGDDWESEDVVATVVCDDDGIRIEDPQISKIRPVSEAQILGNFARAMMSPRRF